MNINNFDFDNEEVKILLKQIGINNESGNNYKEKIKKLRQILDYMLHINKIVSKLSNKRSINIIDCACGKCYLSFMANYYLTRILKKKVNFICVDYNEKLIEKCKENAKNLGYENMTFISQNLIDFVPEVKPDIVYSLHACDTASDMTIAIGIRFEAKYIINVSCCQRMTNHQLKKHPLAALTKHGVYREKLVDMLSDTMRALLLESQGYKVHIFDYVPSSETPKNIMLKAQKIGINNKKEDMALEEFSKLNETFKIKPKLYDFLAKNNSVED